MTIAHYCTLLHIIVYGIVYGCFLFPLFSLSVKVKQFLRAKLVCMWPWITVTGIIVTAIRAESVWPVESVWSLSEPYQCDLLNQCDHYQSRINVTRATECSVPLQRRSGTVVSTLDLWRLPLSELASQTAQFVNRMYLLEDLFLQVLQIGAKLSINCPI